jgi:hypothetical protein
MPALPSDGGDQEGMRRNWAQIASASVSKASPANSRLAIGAIFIEDSAFVYDLRWKKAQRSGSHESQRVHHDTGRSPSHPQQLL